MEHRETVKIPKSEIQRINKLLSIECFDDLTAKELKARGAKRDAYEGVFAVDFDDGSSLTWDLCSGSSNYYDNVVWTSPDGDEDVTLDCDFELGDFEFEIESETYFVNIIEE